MLPDLAVPGGHVARRNKESAVVDDDKGRSRTGGVDELELDRRAVDEEAPIGLRAFVEFAGRERTASNDFERTVGEACADEYENYSEHDEKN